MTSSSNVQGLDELRRNLVAVQTQLESTLPEAAMAGAAVIEQEIEARAPEHTGRLKASLVAKSERRRAAAVATVEIQRSGPDGVEHYAIFQEFGTSKMAARPFFRPGIEAAKPQIKTVMAQAFLAAFSKHAG